MKATFPLLIGLQYCGGEFAEVITAEALARPCTGTWKLVKSSWPTLPYTPYDLTLKVDIYRDIANLFLVTATLENQHTFIMMADSPKCNAGIRKSELVSISSSPSSQLMATAEQEIDNFLMATTHWKIFWDFDNERIMLKINSLWQNEIIFTSL